MMCHLYLPQMIWRRALNGDVNQGNEVGGRLGRNTTFVTPQYSNSTMKVQLRSIGYSTVLPTKAARAQ